MVGRFFVDDDARNEGNVLQQEDFVFPVREPLDEAEPVLVDDPFDQQFIDGESQHVVPPQGDDGFRAGLALYVHGRRCQPPVRFAFPVLQDACHGQRMFVYACFDELLQVVCIDPVVGIAEGQVFAPGVFDTRVAGRAQSSVGFVDDPDPGVFPGIAVADFARGVLAAVVDEQDFVILETLLQQAVQAGAQVGFHVVNRNDDGDEHLCRGKS